MINPKVSGVGRLTRDAEVKYTPSGKAVISAAVAVNSNMDGQPPTFYDLSVWEPAAWYEGADDNWAAFSKGTMVAFEGSLKERSYTKRDGSEAVALDVNAWAFNALINKPRQEG